MRDAVGNVERNDRVDIDHQHMVTVPSYNVIGNPKATVAAAVGFRM